MKNPITRLLLIGLTTAVVFPALGGEDMKPGARIMALDTDGDGRISRAEFKPPRGNRMLEQADTDANGIVTLDEMEKHQEEMMARRAERMQQRMEAMQSRMHDRFMEMDTNGDGGVSSDEMNAAAFTRMDENGDGYLTRDELKRPVMGNRRHRPDMHGRGQGADSS